MPMDVVTQHYVNENTRIYYDTAHQWYYWEGLTEDEAIVFLQSDSDAKDKAGKYLFLLAAICSSREKESPTLPFSIL